MKVVYFSDDKSGILENVRRISFSPFLDKIACEDVNGTYTIIDLRNVWFIRDEEVNNGRT